MEFALGAFMNGWVIALVAYLSLAILTFLPVLRTILKKVPLFAGGPSFEDSPHFSESCRQVLAQNFKRINGTLVFWKTRAERYRRFHLYSLIWVTISTVSVPVLAQTITADPWAKWLLTVVSGHAALLLALTRGFRVEANYKAFRNGESDFYDLYRRMLDRPQTFGATEAEQVARYLEQVEIVRRVVRSAETDNLPAIEEVAASRPPRSPMLPADEPAPKP
ncbi:hypothetical protein AB0J80_27745 [Actinoplanes sp. NPDC049548]|uniref:hypothetical protein n=1 Tax=Actinoplanes sp. NPDC049548 TaxID=3155152 RepID=UPI003415AF3F